jgi:hypothetical protein
MIEVYILAKLVEYGVDGSPIMAFEDIMQAWYYIDNNYVYEDFAKLMHREDNIVWMNDEYMIYKLDVYNK